MEEASLEQEVIVEELPEFQGGPVEAWTSEEGRQAGHVASEEVGLGDHQDERKGAEIIDSRVLGPEPGAGGAVRGGAAGGGRGSGEGEGTMCQVCPGGPRRCQTAVDTRPGMQPREAC